jgi:DNA-binding winged helix-turn-helix (wHTH) protein
MDQTSRHRFFDYEINLETGELRRHGQPVRLQRQPARVLARLVSQAGTLVPREELHAAIWDQGVNVDFERGLNYCIRQLRQALDDDARTPRFIETVARQGYRFVAVVTPVDRTSHGPARGRARRRWRWAVAAALIVVGFAADRVGGGNPTHHEWTVTVARAVHDAVF